MDFGCHSGSGHRGMEGNSRRGSGLRTLSALEAWTRGVGPRGDRGIFFNAQCLIKLESCKHCTVAASL